MRTPANNLRLRLTRGWRIKSVTPRLNNFHNYEDHSITTRIGRSIRAYQQRSDYGLIFSHAIVRRYLNRLFQLNLFFYEGAWCEKKFKIRNRKKFRRRRRGKRFKKREYPRKATIKPHFNPLKNYDHRNLMEEEKLSRLFWTRVARKNWIEGENVKRNWVWKYRRRGRRRRVWRLFLMRQELWFFRFSFLMYGYKKNSNYRLIFHFFEAGQMTANSVANYIVGSLTNQFRVTSTIYRLIKGLQINQFTSGLMVQASGRFTRRQMSTYEEFKKGRIELNKFYSKTRYAFAKVTLKYSLCGIKVWIPPLINVKALYTARLERRRKRLIKHGNARRCYVGMIRKWKRGRLRWYIRTQRTRIVKSIIKLNKNRYPLAYYTDTILTRLGNDKDEENVEIYHKFRKKIYKGMRKWLSRKMWKVSKRRKKTPTLRRIRTRSRNLKFRRRFPRSRHALRKRKGWWLVYLNFLHWKKGRHRKFLYRRKMLKRSRRRRMRRRHYFRNYMKRRKKIYKKISSSEIKKKLKNRFKRVLIITSPGKKKIARYNLLAIRYKKILGYSIHRGYNRKKNFVKRYIKARFMQSRLKRFLEQVRIKNTGWHELKRYAYYKYKYKRRERRFVIWRRKRKWVIEARKEKRKLKAKDKNLVVISLRSELIKKPSSKKYKK
uniref:Ribosomal protein S3 n=1 Tax=Phalansterium sp. PJK-2012 TaxID=1267188 RepID=T1QE26_9EUKA|nr:ribosomal protein S3 [Phalansterium sp. PJK-2012]